MSDLDYQQGFGHELSGYVLSEKLQTTVITYAPYLEQAFGLQKNMLTPFLQQTKDGSGVGDCLLTIADLCPEIIRMEIFLDDIQFEWNEEAVEDNFLVLLLKDIEINEEEEITSFSLALIDLFFDDHIHFSLMFTEHQFLLKMEGALLCPEVVCMNAWGDPCFRAPAYSLPLSALSDYQGALAALKFNVLHALPIDVDNPQHTCKSEIIQSLEFVGSTPLLLDVHGQSLSQFMGLVDVFAPIEPPLLSSQQVMVLMEQTKEASEYLYIHSVYRYLLKGISQKEGVSLTYWYEDYFEEDSEKKGALFLTGKDVMGVSLHFQIHPLFKAIFSWGHDMGIVQFDLFYKEDADSFVHFSGTEQGVMTIGRHQSLFESFLRHRGGFLDCFTALMDAFYLVLPDNAQVKSDYEKLQRELCDNQPRLIVVG